MIGENLYAFMIIGGFIILGGVIAFAKLRNKQAGKDDVVHRDGPPPNYGETRGDG